MATHSPADKPPVPAAAVPPPGRVAGVDYGRKRIGVAICDTHRILASPLCVHRGGRRAFDPGALLDVAETFGGVGGLDAEGHEPAR
ncbi:MAG: RuvX/YqgF family protein [Planctomycetia bacterium]